MSPRGYMEGPAAEEAERRLEEQERGVGDGAPAERAAVFGSTADDPEPHFLGWADEVDRDELFASGTVTDVRTQRERMLAGDLYIADDPELARESLRAQMLAHDYNTTAPSDAERRRRILTELLGSVGEATEIRPPFYCDYGYNTHIGARTFANFGLVALDVARITIGDDVQIGPYVQLLTPTHPLEPEPRRAKWEAAEPISIADNVWLGGGVIVGPGVEIGANTVVGAGAVVTKELPPGVLALGVPARVVRSL